MSLRGIIRKQIEEWNRNQLDFIDNISNVVKWVCLVILLIGTGAAVGDTIIIVLESDCGGCSHHDVHT